jgi:monoamine oxidase
MRSQDKVEAISADKARRTSVAIVGGGIAGLMASHLLSTAGIENWHIYESSQRLGGRIRTVYLNNTKPEQYQYQEIGPMRIPVEIKYTDTNEWLPFADHRMVTRLVETLNEKNAPNHPELLIKFIPFIMKATNITTRAKSDRTNVDADTRKSTDLKHISRDMYRAHKAAFNKGLTHWSEGGYIRYVLGTRTNITDYLAATDQNGLWESLYWDDDFATARWKTIDKGFNLVPRAFSPYVANKTTLGCHVNSLKYEATTDKISVGWGESSSERRSSSKQYDYAIVASPFTKVRLWDLPRYSALLHRAIMEYQFDQSCKVALHYKSRFWEHVENPIFGGCTDISDVPGIGDVCYPSYALNSSGPGVVLASFNHGNIARSTAALSTEDHVARAQRSMERIHGDIARQQYTGKKIHRIHVQYTRHFLVSMTNTT